MYGGYMGFLYLPILEWVCVTNKINENKFCGTSIGSVVLFLYICQVYYYKKNIQHLYPIIDKITTNCYINNLYCVLNGEKCLNIIEEQYLNSKTKNLTFIELYKETGIELVIKTTRFISKEIINDYNNTPRKSIWKTVIESSRCIPMFSQDFDGFYSHCFIPSDYDLKVTNDSKYKNCLNTIYIDIDKIKNCQSVQDFLNDFKLFKNQENRYILHKKINT